MKKELLIWFITFAVLFGFSMDFWKWNDPVTFGWLNLPVWVYYFMMLQFALSVLIYRFAKQHWKEL